MCLSRTTRDSPTWVRCVGQNLSWGLGIWAHCHLGQLQCQALTLSDSKGQPYLGQVLWHCGVGFAVNGVLGCWGI
jgi:hypothetical protein